MVPFKKIVCGLAVAVLSMAATAFAVTPRSINYTFEYVAVGMGGGVSSSGLYELTAYADESSSANKSESNNYSIEPVVGAPDDDAPVGTTAVENWTLYQ